METLVKGRRGAVAAALAAAMGVGMAPTAAWAAPGPAGGADRTSRSIARDDGWHGDGLELDAADNHAVDAFLKQAEEAEKEISPRVRAAAVLSEAELIGFDQRLKSPDSLKRKVATSMKETPGQTVNQALATMKDSVRYTLQWPDGKYTSGVTLAANLLSAWGDDAVKWSNTWDRPKGYKGINSAWREPRWGHSYEVQFHTPASKKAQLDTHKIYEEQRLPGTPPERAKELQAQQDAIFAAVPVPARAAGLTAPGSRVSADPSQPVPVAPPATPAASPAATQLPVG
ncbi:ATP nucleotide 3'-pyrophosphokinase [Streptomyces netropsis]|uniref:ATP nucleotide 3'-pyrophosphokinase n=1 Tax=Streptomyces netropsis TaxID=55404 RepID=UPI0037939549